jgi:hypothetical protein
MKPIEELLMKLKHSVKIQETEVAHIFNIVSEVYETKFSTTQEQEEALLQAKFTLEDELQELINEAFHFGKKIGKYNADKKDQEMYA